MRFARYVARVRGTRNAYDSSGGKSEWEKENLRDLGVDGVNIEIGLREIGFDDVH
jgi:hypothetical protein